MLAAIVVASIPKLYRAIRSGSTLKSITGITESWDSKEQQISTPRQTRGRKLLRLESLFDRISSTLFWSIPGIELDLGQSEFCPSKRSMQKPSRSGFGSMTGWLQSPNIYRCAQMYYLAAMLSIRRRQLCYSWCTKRLLNGWFCPNPVD